MEGKIVTDICVLAFFMTLIALRRNLFTEGFLKFLKENWIWLGIPIGIIVFLDMSFEPLDTPYTQFIAIICVSFLVYYFIYGYFVVNTLALKERRGFKKVQIIYSPLLSLFGIYAAYDYFTTQPYHSLDIIIFVFFLCTVIYVSYFLLKETFFSKGRVNNNKPKL